MGAGVGSAIAEGMVVGFFSAVLILALIGVYRLIKKTPKAAKSAIKGLSNTASARKLADSEAEEHLYEQVRHEYESGEIRPGLWTKAEATANSIEEAAIRAKYFQLRFEQLLANSRLEKRESKGSEADSHNEIIQKSPTVEKPTESKVKKSNALTDSKKTNPPGYAIPAVFVIVIGLLLWIAVEIGPPSASISIDRVEGINGIELGMTKAEVTVRKGAPDFTSGKPEWRDDWEAYLLQMDYDTGQVKNTRYLSAILVGSTPEQLAVWRLCTNDWQNTFSGIVVGRTEKDVLEVFGSPDYEIVADDELSKTMHYRTNNIYFRISEGEVSTVCIERDWEDPANDSLREAAAAHREAAEAERIAAEIKKKAADAEKREAEKLRLAELLDQQKQNPIDWGAVDLEVSPSDSQKCKTLKYYVQGQLDAGVSRHSITIAKGQQQVLTPSENALRIYDYVQRMKDECHS